MARCNINNLLGYSTTRIVKIRDWRLGLTYYVSLLAIFVYVVVYSVIIEQRYRQRAIDVVGSTRLQLRVPDLVYSSQPAQTVFCAPANTSSNHQTGKLPLSTADVPIPQFPCRYYDQYDATDPGLEPGAMLVTTRITETASNLPNGCSKQPIPQCQYVSANVSDTYYIGDVEMMTLLVDHTFSSVSLKVSRSGLNMQGVMLDQNGNAVNPCADYAAFPNGCPSYVGIGQANGTIPDIFPLKTLLRAAGVSSLDDQAGSLAETHRQAGIVLVVSISYSNFYADTGSFREAVYSYTYSVLSISDAEFKYEEVIPSPGSGATQRTILDRHGIRILIKQSGNIGVFDVQTALVNLTSSLGLLAVAAIIVDFLAGNVMPLKNIYSQYKQIQSVSFDELHVTREDLQKFAQEDLVNPKPAFVETLKEAHQRLNDPSGLKAPLIIND
jgi:hypothetical protein